MARGSTRPHRRSKNASRKGDKVTKKQQAHDDLAKSCVVPEKGSWISCDNPSCPVALVQPSPLSCIGWGFVEDELLNTACKDHSFRHSKLFIQKHPNIQPHMRSILLDWLIEVSEAYTLHRQTFYLAQDYFDRFMLTQNNTEKGTLQLIGITCLFIASKMEEANPPKLSEMTYVTAGTFYEEEIVKMELLILKALRWNLCPETALSWLTLYFQIASMKGNSDLLEPQFPQDVYIQMTQLLDLCVLNIKSLDFHYPVLAASVCCHFLKHETVKRVSGFSINVIEPCVNWMAPFAESVRWYGQATVRDFNSITKEERHNIQTHADYMAMLDKVGKKHPTAQRKPHTELLENNCEVTEEGGHRV